MMKLSDYIIKCLEDHGVKHIFMLTGGGAMHLNDSAGKSEKIEYICYLHEQACSIAAEAHARVTNNVGVTIVTTGPGATNTVTGVTAAWIESTPTLFISGQVKLADQIGDQKVRQMGMQEVDIISIVKPVTKYAVMIKDPKTVRYHVEKALYLAKSGRPGPVWLDIPLDIQGALIDPNELVGFDPAEVETSPVDYSQLHQQISQTIEYLNNSERPVIMGGNGIRLGEAIDEFIELVNYLNIPVLTSWNGIDLIWEDHELFIGRPGGVGHRGANFTQQNADFLLTIGARLNLLQTGWNYQAFARAAKKVMVDIDEAELKKKSVFPDVAVSVDSKIFIQELLKRKDEIKIKDRTAWLSRCKDWKQKYPVVLPEYWEEKDFANSYCLLDEISAHMKSDDVFVAGSSGSCIEVSMQTFKVKRGQRVFTTKGLASMGFGLPASIAACLAADRRRTVLVNGDGGFHMNIQELATLKGLELPVKIFILNNNGYSSIRATQKNFFNEHYVGCSGETKVFLPDLIRIAKAYDIQTEEIHSNDDIKAKVKKVLETPGPILCNVHVSPDQPIIPRQASYQKKDGSMESRPLEDLRPFLSREELKENMYIPLIED
jgi:acetolactate synthase I/II/III large subunit